MPTSTIGRASIAQTQIAATAVTGWSATTPCGAGVLVMLPSANAGTIWYRFLTGPNDTTVAMPIPTGAPYTINPAGLCQGGTTPTLANLFFISDTGTNVFAAEAIG